MRFACFDRWNEPKPDPTGVTEAKWTSGVDGTRSLELTCVGGTNVGKGDRIVFTDPRGHLQETIVVSPEHRREDTRIITSLYARAASRNWMTRSSRTNATEAPPPPNASGKPWKAHDGR